MKKAFLYLSILTLLLIAESCKKPCYTCWGYVFSAVRIDTFNYYGVVKYDTTGGGNDTVWSFETCETNSKYTYGNLTFTPKPFIDTIINCQQNNFR
jgi:hypothetical protein